MRLALIIFFVACGSNEPESRTAESSLEQGATAEVTPTTNITIGGGSLNLISRDCDSVASHMASLIAPVSGVPRKVVSSAFSKLCRDYDWPEKARICKRSATSLADLSRCQLPPTRGISPRWNGRSVDCDTVASYVVDAVVWNHSGEPVVSQNLVDAKDVERRKLMRECSNGWSVEKKKCLLSSVSLDVMSVCFLLED